MAKPLKKIVRFNLQQFTKNYTSKLKKWWLRREILFRKMSVVLSRMTSDTTSQKTYP
jgi:hypothetical protein